MKDKTYFSYRKTGYIVRNCYSKSRGISVIQIVYKEELNIINRDYNLESVYKEDNYNRDNNQNPLSYLSLEEVILEDKVKQV